MPKFSVSYTIHGRAWETIEAESEDAARATIEARVESDDFDIDLDDVDDVDFHISEMHPVTRDGKEIWTTYVTQKDVRGHASAIKGTPLFNKEAAAAVSTTEGVE